MVNIKTCWDTKKTWMFSKDMGNNSSLLSSMIFFCYSYRSTYFLMPCKYSTSFLNSLTFCHSKYIPWTSSISVIWELVWNAKSQPTPNLQNWYFHEIARKFLYTLDFAKHYVLGIYSHSLGSWCLADIYIMWNLATTVHCDPHHFSLQLEEPRNKCCGLRK